MYNNYEPNMHYIKNKLPNLKPFYDKIINKKVYCNYYVAIPFGKKYLAWFTHYNNENVCIFLQIRPKDNNFIINRAFILPVCFDNSLSLNTIFYGTIVGKNKYFCIEDIYYYKNKFVHYSSNERKLQLYEHIFNNEIKQISLTKNNIIFSLPIMNTSFKLLINKIENLPYNIYCIQHKFLNKKDSFRLIYKSTNKNNKIFQIKADEQTDIYKLFCKDKTNDIMFYDYAYVPNYNISKNLNNLFRTIKENKNLDFIEESDDEDDFEDNNIFKYVDLEKTYNMKCVYNENFKKWTPISIEDDFNKICNISEL